MGTRLLHTAAIRGTLAVCPPRRTLRRKAREGKTYFIVLDSYFNILDSRGLRAPPRKAHLEVADGGFGEANEQLTGGPAPAGGHGGGREKLRRHIEPLRLLHDPLRHLFYDINVTVLGRADSGPRR
eukprot:4954367-Pyramimonas_sp.AAC.1